MDAGAASRLAAAPPLAGLAPATIAALAHHARERRLARGEALLRAGEVAGALYVVVDGRLRAVAGHGTAGAHDLAVLSAGTVIGEIAALAGGRREATVVADTAATVIELDHAGVELLLEREPEVAQRLAALATARLHDARLARQIADLFPDADAQARRALLDGVDWLALAAGETLVRRGDPADAAYVVVAGRLRVLADDAAGPADADATGRARSAPTERASDEPPAEVGPGELVGEAALVDGGVRAATLVAVRESQLARLPRELLLEALRHRPEALLGIVRTALRRSAGPRSARGGERRCVALVAVHPHVDVPAIAHELLATLSATEAAGLLTASDADAALGRPGIAAAEPGGPAALRLGHWLHEQEHHAATLLLHADAAFPAWHDVALRQADHVVYLADAAAEPTPTAAERRAHAVCAAGRATAGGHGDRGARARPRASLVLLHAGRDDRAGAPRGTARWLELRAVDACYHVRQDRAGDHARLARTLAERPVGVVLSGGGARGFAHLGAVRALEEAGVPIDVIGGTSIGAAMATFVALGHPAEERVPRAKATLGKTMDWTLPVAALVKGARMTELADRQVEGRDIEDLWLPWFAVSTNLSRAELTVHRRGPLLKALRASTAIPGVIPPVVYGDELHVDGGVLDNLPMRTMRRLNPRGPVVAIDVAEPPGLRAHEDFGLSVSGWRLLAGRVFGRRRSPRVPAVATTLTRAMLAGSSRERDESLAEGQCDRYIRLELPRCGLLDFEAADRLIAAGYESAAPRAQAWAEALATGGVRTPSAAGAEIGDNAPWDW